MKTLTSMALGAALIFSSLALNAAEAKKDYQVTGPILEVTPTTVTVEKAGEKWQLALDKNTKIKGELKVGAKVTIEYQMVAKQVEVKEPKAKK